MKSKNFNFNIILLCSSIFTIIVAIFFISMYSTTKNIIEEKIGLSAKNIAMATSISIMENIDGYQSFLVERNIDSPYYINMQKKLATIKDGSNVKYIYTLNIIDNDNVEYILSAENFQSSDYLAPGTKSKNSDMIKTVLASKQTYYFKIKNYYNDNDFMVAYAPILDNDNNVIGILGAAIDQAHLFDAFDRLIISMIFTFIILLIIIIVLLKKIIPFITEPMNKDKLTNAYNKRYYEDYIKEKTNTMINNNHSVAIMMLDLDHFKMVNDTYGHLFGDKVLKSAATTISKHLRGEDNFIRYGGEEFMLIFSNMTKRKISDIAERIRSAIENETIFNEEQNKEIKITVSIGIAFSNKKHKHINKLIEEADKALYKAKVERNKVCVFKN